MKSPVFSVTWAFFILIVLIIVSFGVVIIRDAPRYKTVCVGEYFETVPYYERIGKQTFFRGYIKEPRCKLTKKVPL